MVNGVLWDLILWYKQTIEIKLLQNFVFWNKTIAKRSYVLQKLILSRLVRWIHPNIELYRKQQYIFCVLSDMSVLHILSFGKVIGSRCRLFNLKKNNQRTCQTHKPPIKLKSKNGNLFTYTYFFMPKNSTLKCRTDLKIFLWKFLRNNFFFDIL